MHLEDISAGDWITPLDGGKPRNLQDDSREEARSIWASFVYGAGPSNDQRGTIFHVVAVDFPFAVCRYAPDKQAMIDLRDHVWKRLSLGFVEAATGK